MLALGRGDKNDQAPHSDPDVSHNHWNEEGADMGDKGGKKDKEKNKQQQLTKHKQVEQKKQDNAPAKKVAAAGTSTN